MLELITGRKSYDRLVILLANFLVIIETFFPHTAFSRNADRFGWEQLRDHSLKLKCCIYIYIGHGLEGSNFWLDGQFLSFTI